MKYIFLGCFLPDAIYPAIVKNSKGSVSNAADALQKSFVEGLSEALDNFSILNFPSIGMWPKTYRKLFFHQYNYTYVTHKGKSFPCINPGFLNLYMYSRHDIDVKAQQNIGKIVESSDETVCVFVYAILPRTMHACYKIKKKYGDKVRFVLIVPDLPEYQGVRKHYLQEVLLKRRQRNYDIYYHAFDGFIFLTKYMADRIPVGRRPWTVIEGIYNFKDDVSAFAREDLDNTKSVFYSGTLDERFGIMNLVDAFCMTSNSNYRLVLCGAGDTVEKIKEKAKLDNRINYLGQLPRSEVLRKQREATLLVNPRTPEGEFTKYSFPSKTMEYLASGVPTLIYSLPGIPDEYLNYCFHLEEMGVDALYSKIEEIFHTDSFTLKDIGAKARHFILDNKNPYKQCLKVLELINCIG